MSDVELIKIDRGDDVLVRGRRVPMLTARERPGGKILLVFDDRIAVELDASNYERVTAFVADVMENVMYPECGRTFNRVREIAAAATRDQRAPEGTA